MVRVAIVGCGGIGSRHAQGAARAPEVSRIDCVDVDKNSIDLCKTRLEEINHDKQVVFHSNVASLTEHVDVCIVATPSKNRKQVILDILDKINVKYFILEKIVFQTEEDFNLIEDVFLKQNIKCWVNCYSRAEERYKEVKKNIAKGSSFKMIAEYPEPPNFNLGSSVIHILDLFCYLRNDYNLKTDLGGLEKTILESKHAGYMEFTGRIQAQNKFGDSLDIRPQAVSSLRYTIQFENMEYVCSEDQDFYFCVTNKQKTLFESEFLWQNSLTNLYIRDIINNETCDLPTLNESYKVHRFLLEAVRDHFKIEVVNIT